MKQHDFIKDSDANGGENIIIAHAKKRKLDIIVWIVCLALAFVLWIYFVNMNDDDATAEIKVTLDVVGKDALSDATGQMVYGLDTKEVTIVVKGTNRDLKKYGSADYKASIDVSKISGSGKHILDVIPDIPEDTGLKLSVESVQPQNVIIYSDVVVTESVDFEVVGTGIQAQDPYKLGNITKSTDKVQITGPKIIVDSIRNGGKAQFRISESAPLLASKEYMGFSLDFCDRNGEYIIYDESIITYTTSDIKVTVPVYLEKSLSLSLISDGVIVNDQYNVSIEIDGKHSEAISIVGEPTRMSRPDVPSGFKIQLTEEDVDSGSKVVTFTKEDLPSDIYFDDGSTVVVIITKKNS